MCSSGTGTHVYTGNLYIYYIFLFYFCCYIYCMLHSTCIRAHVMYVMPCMYVCVHYMYPGNIIAAWGFQSWKSWMVQSQSSSRNLTHQNHTRPCYTLRHICHRFSIVDNPLVICKHRTTCSNCQTICHRSPYHRSPHLP